jgi:hypothetical protein
LVLFDPITQGYVHGSGNGSYILDEVPFSEYGLKYYVHLYFANYSGLQALDANRNPVDYWQYTNWFTGRTALPYYAEVSGLIGADLYSGKISSSGRLPITWDNMNTYFDVTAKLAWPVTTGTPTQSIDDYNSIELGQNFEYVIFVFRSAGGSAPVCSWPRPVDANGTWYYAGKTNHTYASIIVPIGSTYSLWVGFGNKDTLRTSGLPFDSILSTIYMEN